MRSARWMTLAATAVLTLAACGGDGNGGTGPGNGGGGATASFSATVSGDVQGTVKGDARYGLATDPDLGSVFGVEMSEGGTGGGLIQLIHLGTGIPGTGSYSISDAVNGTPADGDWVAVAYDADNGQLTAVFVATGGTVKVTRASGGTYEGTFDFSATGTVMSDPSTPLTVGVTGKFKATSLPGGAAIRALPELRSR